MQLLKSYNSYIFFYSFSYTIRILLQGFMAMSCTRVSHYFLSPNYIAHHLTLSTETKSDFLLNVSAR